jgi:hypothetical protein
MKKAVSILLFLGASCCALFTVLATNDNGIHIISENAVYIQGEACVVNVDNTTNEQLKRDLQGCSLFHDILAD